MIFDDNKDKKVFALLIDPDKYNKGKFAELLNTLSPTLPDVILIGGSLLFNDIDLTIQSIKETTNIPTYIFPGSNIQLSNKADGILFTTLISGRNPDFLIGNQVQAAPFIKKFNLQALSVGYMLIGDEQQTSVRYMSNTLPIPYNKPDIAVATALAGELLGLQAIYLEAGSGATKHVSSEMIQSVKANINIPLIVGGGIKTDTDIKDVYNSGADMIVIGTAFEQSSSNIEKLKNALASF